jgi:hypothetical protein
MTVSRNVLELKAAAGREYREKEQNKMIVHSVFPNRL